MNHFRYQGPHLFAEEVPLWHIAEHVGTPTYVYSTATLKRHFHVLKQAFAKVPHVLCYSVKANSNLALLSLLAEEGAGFDIVSEGELRRVQQVQKGPASKVVFSGVGKTPQEMALALKSRILMFNVESAEELWMLNHVATAMGKRAPFSIRVNPDVNPKTHKYIATGLKTSKFGVPFEEAAFLYRESKKLKGLEAVGVDCHIGSQLTTVAPLKAAFKKVASFYAQLKSEGLPLQYVDVGGGLGITYNQEKPPSVTEYAKVVSQAVREMGATVVMEPGRVLVGNAGVLLTRVLYRKKTALKHFVIVDAGMNDLLRPALYEAYHQVQPLLKRKGRSLNLDVVGPVCESSDVLAQDRALVDPHPNDVLAVMSAGAYAMSMSSTYNSRLRPAEVLVEGGRYRVIREREKWSDLWRGEQA